MIDYTGLLITLVPLAWALFCGPGPFRSRWYLLFHVFLLIGVGFDLAAMWPRADPVGDPITVARHQMAIASINVELGLVALASALAALAVFFVKLRRSFPV